MVSCPFIYIILKDKEKEHRPEERWPSERSQCVDVSMGLGLSDHPHKAPRTLALRKKVHTCFQNLCGEIPYRIALLEAHPQK